MFEETERIWSFLERDYQEHGTSPLNYYSQAMQIIHEQGLDAERFPEWAIGLLVRPWPEVFSTHQVAAANILEKMGLSRREQAALCQMNVDVLCDHWSEILALQGKTALERIVDVRRRVYVGISGELSQVLRISRLSRLDEWVLFQTLERGRARDREEMLILIDEFDLDSPELRRAARECSEDCDEGVRDRAHELCAGRGW